MDIQHYTQNTNPLSKYYQNFNVSKRILLTGHSHQAWPDVARTAQDRAYLDAAEHVDDKWQCALKQAHEVIAGYRKRLGDQDGHYTLASSTHDLMLKLLSACDFQKRPLLVTTDGEFHAMRRQFNRLAEAGVELRRIPKEPHQTLAQRLAKEVSARCSMVFVSKVMYEDARIVDALDTLQTRCTKEGALLVIDTYHALNVLPFDIHRENLEHAYLVGGGYKYCQLGEGNAFLRRPSHCRLRPVATGWFAEFESLDGSSPHDVSYPIGGERFAGATYDPSSHYRGAAVFDFFDQQKLHPTLLSELNFWQKSVLLEGFLAQDFDPQVIGAAKLKGHAGFLSFPSPKAAQICAALKSQGLMCDSRGHYLRLGPAPYLSKSQLQDAIFILRDVIKAMVNVP